MPKLSLDPVPFLSPELSIFRDNVQLNYEKIQDVFNIIGGKFSSDGTTFDSGVARIGTASFYGNFAGFAHSSKWAAGQYALLQESNGTTYLNAYQNVIYFRRDNINIGYFDSGTGKHMAMYGSAGWDAGGGERFQFWDDGNFHCSGIGVGRDNTWNVGIQSANDIWSAGNYAGPWGGNGGALKTRGGGNVFSAQWGAPLDLYVDNSLIKTFVIDHPTNKKKYLVHGTLEGPEAGVYYRGQSQLVDGWVEIKLPSYFEALCKEEDRSVQITCMADDPEDEWCPVLHATYPKKGKFYVGLGSGMRIPDQKFWWEVKAVRKDVLPLNIEPLKNNIEVMGQGPYTYYREKTV